MLILKYNFYASYNKLLEYYFKNNNSIFSININKPARVLHNKNESLNFEQDKLTNDIYNTFVNETCDKKLKLIEKYPNKYNIFLDRVEDKILLHPNPIYKILNNYEIKDDIFVLLPIHNFKQKLYSIVFREHSKYIDISNFSIDEIINFRIRNHINPFDPFCAELDIFNDINFEYMFLYSYVDELINLHISKKIILLPLSIETILHDHKKIFNRLNLTSEINDSYYQKMPKTMNTKNTNIFFKYYNNFKNIVLHHEKLLYEKLNFHNIEIL